MSLKLVEHTNKVPEIMPMYPTMDSVADAVKFIEAQVPLMQTNQVFSLLMMFQNTVLNQLNQSVHQSN